MATVQTAHGPAKAAAPGRVLMHEHVFVLGTKIRQNHADAWGDEKSRVSDAVARLRALNEGGTTEEQFTTMVVDNPRPCLGG